jgi:hypothetical protein
MIPLLSLIAVYSSTTPIRERKILNQIKKKQICLIAYLPLEIKKPLTRMRS